MATDINLYEALESPRESVEAARAPTSPTISTRTFGAAPSGSVRQFPTALSLVRPLWARGSSRSRSQGLEPARTGDGLWCYRPPDWLPLPIRRQPRPNAECTGEALEPGETFSISSRQGGLRVKYLQLADGRGWVTDRRPNQSIQCLPVEPDDPQVYLCTYKLDLPCDCLLKLVRCTCVGDADAYHVGVEVYGREWAFFGGYEGTGVRFMRTGAWGPSRSTEFALGATSLSEVEVNRVLQDLQEEWPSSTYRLLTRNCCHFAEELCKRLGVGPLPDSVMRVDVYAVKEVVNVVKAGKEAMGKSRSDTFSTREFLCGLSAYGRKARGRGPARIPCPRPHDCVRGICVFFWRVRRDRPHRTESMSVG